MNIVFRVDASFKIGIGHMMRCLTLAEELACRGAKISFICHDYPGHSGKKVLENGYQLKLLQNVTDSKENDSEHWFEANWIRDISETNSANDSNVDLLIIDHYGIDYRWQDKLSESVRKVMVIDDLANRKHHCDILLDQTFRRAEDSYNKLLGTETIRLIGSRYALLRPQFSQQRRKALSKRKKYSGIKRILVSFGGMDSHNNSTKILDILARTDFIHRPEIDIVLGQDMRQEKTLKIKAQQQNMRINIFSNVDNMANLMLEADISIGAGGSTSLERCTMALPSIIFIDADNQSLLANNLQDAEAVSLIHKHNGFEDTLIDKLQELDRSSEQYRLMSKSSADVCDGLGVKRVVDQITESLHING